MFCELCGNELPDGAWRCAQCGASVLEINREEIVEQIEQVVNYSAKNAEPKQVWVIIAIITRIVILSLSSLPYLIGLFYCNCKELLADNSVPSTDLTAGIMFFLFSIIAPIFVLGIQTRNRFSDELWHRPSWKLNPLNFKQPLQFFNFASWCFMLTGFLIIIGTLIKCHSSNINGILYFTIGFGIWLGTKVIPVIFKRKFDAEYYNNYVKPNITQNYYIKKKRRFIIATIIVSLIILVVALIFKYTTASMLNTPEYVVVKTHIIYKSDVKYILGNIKDIHVDGYSYSSFGSARYYTWNISIKGSKNDGTLYVDEASDSTGITFNNVTLTVNNKDHKLDINKIDAKELKVISKQNIKQ
ncbi:MAG: hypothetical protein WCX65_16145 [bacterium]